MTAPPDGPRVPDPAVPTVTTVDAEPARGGRAVVTVTDQLGVTRSFWSAWASPEYQIPHLADFLLWADRHHYLLCVRAWLAYADTYPGTLPREEVTGTAAAEESYTGDLDYRYHLSLHGESGAVRLRVRALRATPPDLGPDLATAMTRANLFAEAARLCDLVADRVGRWTDENGGTPPPGTDPVGWRHRAAYFRDVQASGPVAALTANLAARLHPATPEAPHPAIQVAGVWVVASIGPDATLRISVDLDEAQPWLQRTDETVPTQVRVQGNLVYQG